jgi:CDK5 regulatory subunit-associated protein 3
VDRKRIPQDWRKRLNAIRSRISSVFLSLPRDLDPFFLTVDANCRFLNQNSFDLVLQLCLGVKLVQLELYVLNFRKLTAFTSENLSLIILSVATYHGSCFFC